jgi:DNA-directed RNA polymerase specialized sigma24 family protein
MYKEIDKDILLKAQGGDEAAFEEIFNFYYKRVFGLCLIELQNRQIAEDLALEVLTRFYYKLRAGIFDVSRPAGPYLLKSGYNACANWFKKVARDSEKVEFVPILTAEKAEKYRGTGIGEDEI